MTIKDKLLKCISYVVPGKIFRGYGVSADPMSGALPKSPKDPAAPKATNLLFYAMKNDLGPFEIRNVIEKNDVIKYVIYHIETGQEFTMPKKYFDLFFEEIKHEPFKIPAR